MVKVNSGCFKKGHKESPEVKDRRIKSCIKAWVKRSDYHGMYGTKFYNSWRSMCTRCRGTAGEGSKRKYRDRGIKVCDRWLTFKNFYDDMYSSYVEGTTIDRIDNNGNYEPGNCRWATPKQQGQNKRNTIKLTYKGQTKTLYEWSLIMGIPQTALNCRYHQQYTKGKCSIDYLMRELAV